MPTTNEGLDQVEAVVSSDNSTNNAASSAGSVSADPAPRRRRGGRRVVRGVGAAGASLELKVEEHAKAPLFEEPKLEPPSLLAVIPPISMMPMTTSRRVRVVVA